MLGEILAKIHCETPLLVVLGKILAKIHCETPLLVVLGKILAKIQCETPLLVVLGKILFNIHYELLYIMNILYIEIIAKRIYAELSTKEIFKRRKYGSWVQ